MTAAKTAPRDTGAEITFLTQAGSGLLSGRVALVTVASSGLGERFARVLREAGADVVVTARRAERLQQLASQLDAAAVAGDIASAAHRQAVAAAVPGPIRE
jgi:NADP-dependent 3-hydroxy acid dehydrogenase YdfG